MLKIWVIAPRPDLMFNMKNMTDLISIKCYLRCQKHKDLSEEVHFPPCNQFSYTRRLREMSELWGITPVSEVKLGLAVRIHIKIFQQEKTKRLNRGGVDSSYWRTFK